jgi:hypothetical protein
MARLKSTHGEPATSSIKDTGRERENAKSVDGLLDSARLAGPGFQRCQCTGLFESDGSAKIIENRSPRFI